MLINRHKKTSVFTEVFEFGSLRRARTTDPVINSHLLYRLSYQGKEARIIEIIFRLSNIFCIFHKIFFTDGKFALLLPIFAQKSRHFFASFANMSAILQKHHTEMIRLIPVKRRSVHEQNMLCSE